MIAIYNNAVCNISFHWMCSNKPLSSLHKRIAHRYQSRNVSETCFFDPS